MEREGRGELAESGGENFGGKEEGEEWMKEIERTWKEKRGRGGGGRSEWKEE